MEDLDFFQGDEAAGEHGLEGGQEGVDFFLAVHDFDDEGEIGGEAQDFGGMEAAGLAKTHGAAQDGGTGEMGFAGGEHDGFVQGLMVPAVGFAEKNPQ